MLSLRYRLTLFQSIRLNFLALVAFLGFHLPPASSFAQGELLHFRLLTKESQILTEIADPFGQTVTGELTLGEGEARGRLSDLKGTGWVRLTIPAASYNSQLGMRDQDVQDYYLEVKDHPVIAFTSTGIEEIKEPNSAKGPWELTVRGVLDLHGVKKEITVPTRLIRQGKRITAEGSMRVALKDFNIAVPTLLFFLRAGDQAEVKFRFVAEEIP